MCILAVNCAVYSLFQFSYPTFYEPSNIATKPSLKVKSYVKLKKESDKYFTLDPYEA